jgi:hypothetical protein
LLTLHLIASRLRVYKGVTMPKTRLYGACYYCICTACSGRLCPFAHLEYQHCDFCHHRVKQARLECDYFQHYIKTRHFRFRRAEKALEPHSGTYILFTDRALLVGSWAKLEPLRKRLGGTLKKIEFLDFIGGFDHGKS